MHKAGTWSPSTEWVCETKYESAMRRFPTHDGGMEARGCGNSYWRSRLSTLLLPSQGSVTSTECHFSYCACGEILFFLQKRHDVDCLGSCCRWLRTNDARGHPGHATTQRFSGSRFNGSKIAKAMNHWPLSRHSQWN